MAAIHITIEDIREINQRMIDKVPEPGISPFARKVARGIRFTAADINAAYAQARRDLAEQIRYVPAS